ncbi:MAG: zinc-ribbon domain-containing protein [archaeon YNP-LCB-003-016]|nr:zinc-ribbon domain-containing protein [Candidatus Culexarchaeum yellowstonense]
MSEDKVLWICHFCGKKWEAPVGLIINSVRKHLQIMHNFDEKRMEPILNSLREKIKHERLRSIMRRLQTEI